MESSLFLRSLEASTFVLAPEPDHVRAARADAMYDLDFLADRGADDSRSQSVSVVSRASRNRTSANRDGVRGGGGQKGTGSAGGSLPLFPAAEAKGSTVIVAAPDFDEALPADDFVCGVVSKPKSKSRGASSAIVEADGRVPRPEKREMMVRYRSQHGPVSVRSRLFAEACDVINKAPTPTAAGSRKLASKTAVAKSTVGCFIGGSHGIESFATCTVANALPQTESPPAELTAPMQLLRVVLCHLRTIGALPYVLDVTWCPNYAKVTLAPKELHPGRFGEIPISMVRLYPVIGKSGRSAADATRILRFEPLDEAKECDVVVSFAFDAGHHAVGEHPWEPSFIERDVAYRLFTGPSSAVAPPAGSSNTHSSHRRGGAGAVAPASAEPAGDYGAHLEAIAVNESHFEAQPVDPRDENAAAAPMWGSSNGAVSGDKKQTARATRVAPAIRFAMKEIAALQKAYYPVDMCREELPAHGFAMSAQGFSWADMASRLHTSLFIAVHRLWCIMQYRQRHNSSSKRSMLPPPPRHEEAR